MSTDMLPIPDKDLLGQEGGRMAIFGLVQTFFPSSVQSLHPNLTSPSSNSRKRWCLSDFKYQAIKTNAYMILNKKLLNQCFLLA